MTVLLFFFNIRDFHWLLWFFVSRSYSKIHFLFPVITIQSKSGSVCWCSMMSWHTCIWCLFWSSFSSLGTIFVQTIHILPKYLVIISQTLSVFMSYWLAIIWTINQWLPLTTCLTCSMLTSVLLVEGFWLLGSNLTPPSPLWTSCVTQK